MRLNIFHLALAGAILLAASMLVQSQQITVNSSGVYSGTTANTLNSWGGKNVLINGSMAVSQYDATITYATTRTFTNIYRWNATCGGAGVTSITKATNFLRTGKRALQAMRITGNTSVTTVDIDQRIRSANLAGLLGQVAFSAQIYNDTGGAFAPVLLMGTPSASDNFTTTTVINNSGAGDALQSCAASGAWTRVTWTADISGYANIANGLQVQLRIPSGSLNAATKYVAIAEVQLEAGSVCTAFEVLPYEVEASRAQDYVRVYKQDGSANPNTIALGVSVNTTTVRCPIQFGKPIYSAPTLYTSGTLADFQIQGAASTSLPTILTANAWGANTTWVNSGGSMGTLACQSCYLNASSNGWVMFRAEP